jgi:hypothetical protein
MPYRFVTKREDYSDFASGRVFYNAPGAPVFPVRLASEIFQRGMAVRRELGLTGRVVLYDPCCGSAYHLTALAHLHWREIAGVVAADIDAHIVTVATRNLRLLTVAGLEQRHAEIAELLARYGKASHADALQSTQRFLDQVRVHVASHAITTHSFCADATDIQSLHPHLAGWAPDFVLADVPYGQHTAWQGAHTTDDAHTPLWWLLDALRPSLHATTVVAIAADKRQRVAHAHYARVEHFQLGKRQVVLLLPTRQTHAPQGLKQDAAHQRDDAAP